MFSVHFIPLLLIVGAVVLLLLLHTCTFDCSLCMLPSQNVSSERLFMLYGCYIIYSLCFYVTFSFFKSDDEITELEVKYGCPL